MFDSPLIIKMHYNAPVSTSSFYESTGPKNLFRTNGLLVQDNVAYDHLGHCIFLEDGIEMRNVIDRNLAILTRFGTVLPTDRNCDTCTAMADPQYPNPSCSECLALSTYWMTNPDNILTNNVAAGSEFVGIWYIFPERPTGDSEALGNNMRMPLF
jgi:hypothetical protein